MNLSNIKVNNQLVATVDDDLNLSDNLIHNKAIGKFFVQHGSQDQDIQELKDNGILDVYVTSEGQIINFQESGVIYLTDYIDLKDCIKIHIIMQGQGHMGAFYDNNKNFVAALNPEKPETICDFEVENNGYSFLRLNLMQNRVNDDKVTLIYEDVEPTPMPGITITTSQITDYTPPQQYGTFSIKYKISKTLYALGDSVTYGVGDNSNGGWAQRVSNKIEFNNFYKYAVSGATSMHGNDSRGRLSSQISRLPTITDTNIIILVMIGTNDYHDNYSVGDVDAALSKDYSALDYSASFSESFRKDMETIKRQCPFATIIYCLPVSAATFYESRMENFVNAMNKICAALSIPVLNTRAEAGIPMGLNTGNATSYLPDNFHPSPTGHELVANYVASYLMRYADGVILSQS